jgi:phage major head subunit gpT-like protein
MLRTQFTDTYLSTMLPALDAVTMNRYNKYPDQYSMIFNVKNSSRSIEQFSGVTGFGTFSQVAEGAPASMDQAYQGFDKTFTHTDWALAYQTSHQLVRDDKFRIVERFASELGRSAKITVEIEAASDLNNGFDTNFTGPDGKPLFSTTHPNAGSGGGVQANKPSTDVDLDVDSLEAALIAYRGITDDRGKLIMLEPKMLVVPPALEFTAAEILASTQRSDNANNAVNAFKHRDGVSNFTNFTVYNYLTDPDAWFVTCDPADHSLMFFWREKFNILHDMHFLSRSALTLGWEAFSHGWYDWRGWYGSSGG